MNLIIEQKGKASLFHQVTMKTFRSQNQANLIFPFFFLSSLQ